MAETMKVYTLEELVDLLKVTRRTLYNYIKSGRLKAVKMGKYWRVTQKQLDAFFSEGEALGEQITEKERE